MTGKICVIGGDMRNIVAAEEFAKDGYDVCAVGLDKLKEGINGISFSQNVSECVRNSDAVLLPVPFSLDGETVNAPFGENAISLEEVFGSAENDTVICGGMMGSHALKSNVHDYFESEELKVLNAAATAEGAVMIGMQKMSVTLNGANAAVIGYGRIGKLLSHKLKMMGADVTVITRKRSDFAWCEALGYGCDFIKSIENVLPDTDIVFNTVPARVLDETALKHMKREAVIIDLASRPGGTDFEAAESLGIDAGLYPGVPGKNVPLTAGRIIKNTVQCYIKKGKL